MKLTLRLLPLLLVGLMIAACEKLEQVLLDGPTEISTQEQRFLTELDCDGAVRLCYNALSFDDWWQVHFWRLCNEAATDDAWVGDTIKNYDINPPRFTNNPLDTSKTRRDTIAIPYYKRRIELMQVGHYTLDTRGERLRDFYQSNYKGIFLCNNAINGVGNSKIPDNTKNRLVAEAKFLRGFYYFELVKNFGPVPLVTSLEPTQYLDTMRRASTQRVYAQIRKDFTEAAAVLPTIIEQNGKDRGRATQGAALAFLAKAELYEENWAAALTAAEKIINQQDYVLEPNFGDLWNPRNVNSREFIFSLGTGVWQFNAFGNPIPVICGSRAEKGWGYLCPTSNLENLYKLDNDSIRLKWTIIQHGKPVPGDTTKRFNAQPAVSKSARFCRKLYVPSDQRLGGSSSKLPNNVIFMRYADLLLIGSEAAYHLNNQGKAQEYLNQVRARVKLAPVGALDLNTIYRERRAELAFEGQRLFDLRRIRTTGDNRLIDEVLGSTGSFVAYNKTSTDAYETSNKRELQNKGTNFKSDKHKLWPIPLEELSRRGGLTQNKGY